VPADAYAVDIEPVHVAAGGVAQVTPVHGAVQSPVAMSHAPFAAAQFVVVGA
jgi:hypothetical protein